MPNRKQQKNTAQGGKLLRINTSDGLYHLINPEKIVRIGDLDQAPDSRLLGIHLEDGTRMVVKREEFNMQEEYLCADFDAFVEQKITDM